MEQRDLQRYYRRIQRKLPTNGAVSKSIMANIRHSVEDYLHTHPDADQQALLEHFGDPETIAASFIACTDMKELLAEYGKQKRIFRIVLAAVLAALVLWSAAVGYAMWSFDDNRPEHSATDVDWDE